MGERYILRSCVQQSQQKRPRSTERIEGYSKKEKAEGGKK